jgi:hypothetical protein
LRRSGFAPLPDKLSFQPNQCGSALARERLPWHGRIAQMIQHSRASAPTEPSGASRSYKAYDAREKAIIRASKFLPHELP